MQAMNRPNLLGIARTRRGATSIEYGLIAALIAIAVLGALSLLGYRVSDLFNAINVNLPGGPVASMRALYNYLDTHNCGNGNGSLVAAEWSDHYYQVCTEDCVAQVDLNSYFYTFDQDTTGELEFDEWSQFSEGWIETYGEPK